MELKPKPQPFRKNAKLSAEALNKVRDSGIRSISGAGVDVRKFGDRLVIAQQQNIPAQLPITMAFAVEEELDDFVLCRPIFYGNRELIYDSTIAEWQIAVGVFVDLGGGGSLYQVGEVITIDNGVNGQPAYPDRVLRIQVLSVDNNGGILTVSIYRNGGLYKVIPDNPVRQLSSTGLGTGSQFVIVWSSPKISVAKPYLLQKTPWNGQTLIVNEQQVTYDYIDIGKRQAGGLTQSIIPNYFPGDIIIARRQSTGANTGTQQISVADQVAVHDQGTFYAIGDFITLTGGTFGAHPVLLLVTDADPNSGALNAVTIIDGGTYFEIPTNPVSQDSTTGLGIGATFDIQWIDGTLPGNPILWMDLNTGGRNWGQVVGSSDRWVSVIGLASAAAMPPTFAAPNVYECYEYKPLDHALISTGHRCWAIFPQLSAINPRLDVGNLYPGVSKGGQTSQEINGGGGAGKAIQIGIADAGTGYSIDTVLEVDGGSANTVATILVTQVDPNTGAVLAARILDPGDYTTTPDNPVSTSVLTGQGNDDATFNILWLDVRPIYFSIGDYVVGGGQCAPPPQTGIILKTY